ncbi:hypothetical protein C8Q80DRAFT_1097118 [Daedaleopsis nitida]|nr:hypothetical protein C8Q80DRAFT_1097689 [Daedaleopsis nitida]KAI0753505.1 hypothetical protein C8Q80DRAFT_1097118 [Daedaleopsis nitida]
MFSKSEGSHLTIKYARPAITSLAVELVARRLVEEMVEAVKGVHGLHGSGQPPRRGGRHELCWDDISAETPRRVRDILTRHCPLGWHLVYTTISASGKKKEGYMQSVPRMRPADITTTEILSDIAYCRTPYARLNHVTRGILYFACGAQQTLFGYNSWIGHTPSWNTTVATLKRLAALDASYIRKLGRELLRALMMRTDNVQQHLKQWEARMGKENLMKIGMSAIVNEVHGYDPTAFSLKDKQRRILEDKRKDLTVNQLLGWIDFDHASCVGTLHCLQILVTYIPQLHHLKPSVAHLFSTSGAKLPLPQRKTDIYPLSTVAKNENITSEFRDALVDFLGQMGQHNEDHDDSRIILVGGDGLTYERLLQNKGYSGDQDNEFRTFNIIEPFLETWHTGLTHLSMVAETHWGDRLTDDPSKLGHSAAKIGQKAPTSLKKVDYYPCLYVTNLTVETRIIDCWRIIFSCDDIFEHFIQLESEGHLPSLDGLLNRARTLYHRYCSHRAYEQACEGSIPAAGPFAIPKGRPWSPLPRQESSNATVLDDSGGQSAKGQKGKTKKTGHSQGKVDRPSEPFLGDQCLADAIIFLQEGILVREFAQAVATGDPGRVYEAMKRMNIAFAGSSHPKYGGYTLEMIVNLELESSPELKNIFLKNWLVNPSGEVGRWVEGDLHLEHINLQLETMIAHKDEQWDSEYVATVIAPNTSHFVTLKNKYREGVGLAQRRGRHTSPHSRPEVSTMLETFKEEDLHCFRQGRHYGDNGIPPKKTLDVFSLGLAALRESKLAKWVADTRARRMDSRLWRNAPDRPRSNDDIRGAHGAALETDTAMDDGEEESLQVQTGGYAIYVNGELVVDYDLSALDALAAGEEELDALGHDLDGSV